MSEWDKKSVCDLCAWHGLGVHHNVFDCAASLVEGSLQQAPDCGLTRARGPHNHHTHPLLQLCVQLQCLVDLARRKREWPNKSNIVTAALHTHVLYTWTGILTQLLSPACH